MLQLTLTEDNGQTEGEVVYLNPIHVYHIKPRSTGCYIHLGPASTGHGFFVGESANRVAQLMAGCDHEIANQMCAKLLEKR